MRKEVLLIFIIAVAINLVNAIHLPSSCSDAEIKATWDSMFKESSDTIRIFNDGAIVSNRCNEYFAYKIQNNKIHYIHGVENWHFTNYTFISGTKIEATQELKDLLTGFNNLIDTEVLDVLNIVQNYTFLRTTPLIISDLDQEFSSFFKETPKTWTQVDPIIPEVQGETMYSFLKTSTIEESNISLTGFTTLNHEYSRLTFFASELSENSTCIPDWDCGNWSSCVGGNQTRICRDLNNCEEKKTEVGGCGCRPDWNCTAWGDCIGNQQIRICRDKNSCQNESNKPAETQPCGTICEPDWECGEWGPLKCPKNNIQTRICTDNNNCGTPKNKPEETRSCKENFAWLIIFIVLIVIILIIGDLGILKGKIKKNIVKKKQEKAIFHPTPLTQSKPSQTSAPRKKITLPRLAKPFPPRTPPKTQQQTRKPLPPKSKQPSQEKKFPPPPKEQNDI